MRVLESLYLDDNTVAIPRFTYISGQILSVTRPTKRLPQAVLLMQFEKLIFPDGYVIPLSSSRIPVQAVITLRVTWDNELILDHGTAIEFPLRDDLLIDREHAARSEKMNADEFIPPMATASKCVPEEASTARSPNCSTLPEIGEALSCEIVTEPFYCPHSPDQTSAVLVTLPEKAMKWESADQHVEKREAR